MEIDKDAAGLLAQVIPAMLILVALEDRLSPSKITRRKWRRRLQKWTQGVVGAGLVSIILCLWVVISDKPDVFITCFVAISTFLLLVVVFLLFAGMFGRDDDERGPKRRETQSTLPGHMSD
jgi:hypothetical protein